MKTILEVIKLCSGYLEEKGVPAARRQSEELIADLLNVGRMDLYLQFDRPLTEEELQQCRQRLRRKAAREPLQYIRGFVDFFDCRLKVGSAVLIPRQETELLVEKIVADLEGADLAGETFWDLCCGSGCMGIAIKKRFPELRVILSDLSADALQVAKLNAEKNEVEVECRQGDLFAPFEEVRCRYICCNPPYISEEAYRELEPEVREYEPCQALIAGPTGLECYQRISEQLTGYLSPHGRLWLEIGYDQGEEVKRIFENIPAATTRLENDLSGQNRFFFLELE